MIVMMLMISILRTCEYGDNDNFDNFDNDAELLIFNLYESTIQTLFGHQIF
jgi:hypothetical protein